MIYVFAVGVIVFAAVFYLLIRRPGRIAVSSVVNGLFSLYSFNGVPGALPFLLAASVGRRQAVASRAPVLFRLFIVAALLMALAQLVSFAWSITPTAAISSSLRTLTFVTAAWLVGRSGMRADRFLNIVALGAIPGALVGVVSTIAFRVAPSIEQAYYQGPVASFLLGVQATGLYTDPSLQNNVIDPDRAGGVFYVNSNRDALSLGVMLMFFLIVAVRNRGRRGRYGILIAGLVAAILATNSKTGLVLMIICPLFGLIIVGFVRVGRTGLAVVFGTIVLSAALATFIIGSIALPTLVDTSQDIVPRQRLWLQALNSILGSPLLGLGFGGWAAHWTQSGATAIGRLAFPPHNWFLADWLNFGLSAPLLEVFMLVCLFVFVAVGLSRARRADQVTLSLTGAMFLWVFVHGMGDNTDFFGTEQTMVVLGYALGVCALLLAEAGVVNLDPRVGLGGPRAEPAGVSRGEVGPRLPA